ncbi:hypothetical protein MML48_2g00011686 [Holotrichia oblita]|uniref:Uncharacterized protein n=1 Tax=Holotrichia oblita TaxID=644536 RepID=A0ACB9TN54_HOLOL|nr:hypothetical protein MML48_2g00011686 [Holotrichia oblita]
MKITENQKSALIEYLKINNNLISGKFSNTFTQKDAEEKWKYLADLLNSMPGIVKDWKNWRKTWHDMRSRTKLKYSQNRQQRNQTGGGPPPEEMFTKIEEDILDIIKKVSVDGHENVTESVVDFHLPSTSFIDTPSTSADFHDDKPRKPSIKDFSKNQTESESKFETPVIKRMREAEDISEIKKIPLREGKKFKYTNAAVETYQKMTSKELQMKEQYYAAKMHHMQKQQEYYKEKMETKIKDLLFKEETLNALHKLNETLLTIAEAINNF